VTQSKEHDWMRLSLADNLKTQIIKTKKFEVLDSRTAAEIYPEVRMDSLSRAEAVTLAIRLNCEVVTQGRFIVRGGRFRLEMEAADAASGNSISAEKADGKLDGNMFATIDTVVDTLTADLVAKAPVLRASEIRRNLQVEEKLAASGAITPATRPVAESKASAQAYTSATKAIKYNLNAYLSLGVPVSAISNHIGVGLGARATLWRNFLFHWLNPILVADGFYSKGKDFTGMFFYFAGTGLTYPIAVLPKLHIMPFATFGMSGGRLYHQEGYNFAIGALDTGVSAEYSLTERWRLAVSISYRHVFDKFVTGSFLQTYWGAGYVF
jgi:TolB-like protein